MIRAAAATGISRISSRAACSNSRVKPLSGRVQGTLMRSTPWSGQSLRGTRAETKQACWKKLRWRQVVSFQSCGLHSRPQVGQGKRAPGSAATARCSSLGCLSVSRRWSECVQWIRRGGALPESANLLPALTQTTYTFQGDKLLLEPKADLKARIGFSPDEFDALMLSFAHPVTVPDCRSHYRQIAVEYDPFREPDESRVS